MIRLLFYAVLILAGLIVGPALISHKGYVLISLGEYTLETSVIGAVVSILVFFGLLQFAEWAVVKFVNVTGATVTLPGRLRRRKARALTEQGALALAQQDWPVAQKTLAKAAPASEIPVLNYLTAAEAAHNCGDRQSRDQYLSKAEPMAKQAVQVARVRFLVDDNELVKARKIYDSLPANAKDRPNVTRLALDLFRRQQDWDAQARLLPALSRHKALPDQALQTLPQEIEASCLESSSDLAALNQRWGALPRKLKKSDDVARAYIAGLIRFEQGGEAAKLLLARLDKRTPQEALLALLPQAAGSDAKSVLAQAEARFNGNDSLPVLDCLSELAEQAGDWEKAKAWRQKAATKAPSVERYRALARAQEQLGDAEAATSSYRELSSLS